MMKKNIPFWFISMPTARSNELFSIYANLFNTHRGRGRGGVTSMACHVFEKILDVRGITGMSSPCRISIVISSTHVTCWGLWHATINVSCMFMVTVDVSYAAPQAHRIVNLALHRGYSPGIVFIFSQGRKDLYQRLT
jgi:hypothetical protein